MESSQPAAPESHLRLRSLWPLFIAYAVSQLGNWMFRAGAVYDIFDKQGGAGTLLGWTILCVYLPILAGGKWLAPLADKYNSLFILILLDLLCLFLLIPIMIWSDMSRLSNVILALIVIVGLSLATPLFTSAQSSIIRKNVAPEQVASAMSVLSNISWATNVLGAMCGSLLLLVFSFRSIIIIDLATFAISVLILFVFMRRTAFLSAAPQARQISAFAPDASKVKWVLLLSIFFLNLGAGVINMFPAVAARDIYHTDQIGLSYFYLGNGIGGFLGTLLIPGLRKSAADVPLMAVSSLLVGIFLLAMGWFPGALFSVAASSLMLLCGQVFGVVAHSYLLTSHAPEQAGRTSGLFMFATFLGVAVNAGLFSLLFAEVKGSVFSAFLQFCGVCSLIAFAMLAAHEYRKGHKLKYARDSRTESSGKGIR